MRTLALMVAALAACAINPPAPTTPEERQALVTQRVDAYWQAQVKDDLNSAYAFLSPGSKKRISLERFKATARRNAYRAAKIDNIECGEETCQVRVKVTFDHRLMKGIIMPLNQSWIIEDGQAWLVRGGR
jgi:hypothetical protein